MPELSRNLVAQLENVAALLNRVLQTIKLDDFVPSEQLLRHYEKFRSANKCLFCGKKIEGENPKRGTHSSCYQTMQNNFRSGEWNERDLLEQGRIGLPGKPGRKGVKEPPPIDDPFSPTLAERQDPFVETNLEKQVSDLKGLIVDANEQSREDSPAAKPKKKARQ